MSIVTNKTSSENVTIVITSHTGVTAYRYVQYPWQSYDCTLFISYTADSVKFCALLFLTQKAEDLPVIALKRLIFASENLML